MISLTRFGLTLAVVALTSIVAISIPTTVSAQTTNAQAPTLGEPFLVEKGKTTGQKEIGPNRTQFTYSANGTLNGNIEITDTGDYVSVSKGNNLSFDLGQGVIATKDGSETANYTLIEVDNVTQEGKLVFQGAAAYSTNSTGKLSFLNNMMSIYKGEGDIDTGDFVLTEWEWK